MTWVGRRQPPRQDHPDASGNRFPCSCGGSFDTSVRTHAATEYSNPDADIVIIERYGISCTSCGQKANYEVKDSFARLLKAEEEAA